ncbi:MAG: hypothetical protein PVH62_01115 [Anaerolineae bacterium]|jgi:hypothetical protein
MSQRRAKRVLRITSCSVPDFDGGMDGFGPMAPAGHGTQGEQARARELCVQIMDDPNVRLSRR